jgi:hypothetical protein
MTSSPLKSPLELKSNVLDKLSKVVQLVNKNPDQISALLTFVDNLLRPVCRSCYWIANVDLVIEYEEFKTLDQLKSKWLQINQFERDDDDSSDEKDNEEEKEDDENEKPYQVHSHSNRVMFGDYCRDIYVFSHCPN